MRASSLFALGAALTASAESLVPCQESSTPYCPPRSATPEKQRAILNEFIQAFYKERNATKAMLGHVAEDYIQHNPDILSGRQNSLDALSQFLSPSNVNYTIINTGLDNNIAYIHYRMDVTGASEPSAVIDVFRFDGTCIMEHWDVAQQRPANATNPIAMF
ncbi:hypothetical protein CGCSCA1_v012949 [Colletotrichum siamense]|nr:hypothetical protein CGCSCA1_v012949 [Colletotrichum siamense]